MVASPNPLLYWIGKGIASLQLNGAVTYRDLGNAPEVEVTPALDKLDHFSSRTPVRTKDRTVVREKSATLRIVLDEITAENLALALMANPPETNTAGDMVLDILSASEIRGSFKLVGTNAVGQQCDLDIPIISIVPENGIPFISDEFGQIELTADILADENGSFGTVTVRENDTSA